MAEPLIFREDWVVQMKEMLNNDADNNRLRPNTAAIMRVATPLLETKPEAYIPNFLSLGPYHRSKLEKHSHSHSCGKRNISTVEAYKGKLAASVSCELRQKYGKSFDSIIEMMKLMRPEIESFYHWPTVTEGEYSQNFDLMMAIDSCFLLQILIFFPIVFSSTVTQHLVGGHRLGSGSLDDEMISLCANHVSCIMYDIMKLENQIPLSALKRVFENAKEALTFGTAYQDFDQLLGITSDRLSPFPFMFKDLAEDECRRIHDAMASEPHLLGRVHASLSLFLEMKAGGRSGVEKTLEYAILIKKLDIWFRRFLLPSDPGFQPWQLPNGLCAEQLARRAGIKFKSYSKPPYGIRLDKDSGTLYLPQICVCDIGTEVILRNMLALEFNDPRRPKFVTRYVALMGNLIQSPDDVRLLVDGGVISRGEFNLNDDGLCNMWKDVRQPFLRGSAIDVHDELYDVLHKWFQKNYLKIRIKRKALRIYEYVSKWKFIASIAGFLGLALTAIQTYCSFHQCSSHIGNNFKS